MHSFMDITSACCAAASMTPSNVTLNQCASEDEVMGEQKELYMKMACIGTFHKQELTLLDHSLDLAIESLQSRLSSSSQTAAVTTTTTTTCDYTSPIHQFLKQQQMVQQQQQQAQQQQQQQHVQQHVQQQPIRCARPSLNADIAKKLKSKYSESTLREAKIFKKRKGYPKHITAILNQWYEEHEAYPYPSQQEKEHLSAVTGLSIHQLSTWFSNTRIRTKRREEKRRARSCVDKKEQEQQSAKKQLRRKSASQSVLDQCNFSGGASSHSATAMEAFIPCMVPVYFYDPSSSMPFFSTPTTSHVIPNVVTNNNMKGTGSAFPTLSTNSDVSDDVFLKLEDVDQATAVTTTTSTVDPPLNLDSLMADHYTASQCSLVGISTEHVGSAMVSFFN